MGKKKKKNIKGNGNEKNILSSRGKINHQFIKSYKWRHIIVISLICFAAYANTLSMNFVWDDLYQIKENSQIKSLKNIPSMFMSEVWAGVEGGHRSPYYRPLFTISLAIDYFLWGENPSGFHLTNIILHFLATLVIYFLTARIASSYKAAFFSGLLFAVHPVHTEAVAWISGRNEMLSALFMFLSFYLYLLFREKKLKIYMAGAVLAYFLALLSKEIAITLPAIIFLYEIYATDSSINSSIKRKLTGPILYMIVIIPYIALRLSILSMQTWTSYPIEQRLYTGFDILIRYLKMLILPVGLKLHYEIPIKKSLLEGDVLTSIIIFFLVTVGFFLTKKFDKRVFFGFLFLMVTLFPVSGFPTIIQPSPMAVRYLYIPSFGFALVLGVLLQIYNSGTSHGDIDSNVEVHPKKYMKAMNTLWILLISALFIVTFQQNYVWKDQLSFAVQRVKDAPNYAVAHYDLGLELSKLKQYDDAINEFNKALSLKPDFISAYNNLGAVYMEKGLYDEALSLLKKTVKMGLANANIYYNIGIISGSKGFYDESIEAFQNALRLRPNDANIRYNLGVVYFRKGLLDDAEREFRYSLNIKPDNANARYNLGALLIRQGNIEDAVKQFEEALRLDPGNEIFKKNLYKAYELLQKQ